MPNPNPKTEQLALGRGKRPKLDNKTVGMRMSSQTRQNLEKIAEAYSIFYGEKPWIAGLLEKIANGSLIVVPAPPIVLGSDESSELEIPSSDLKQKMKKYLKDKHYNESSKSAQEVCSEARDDSKLPSLSRSSD